VELWSICNKGCNHPICAQIGQNSFDLESFEYFKIRGYLEEVAIIKSVPNWISYSHEFFQILSYFLAIFPRWNLISGFI
jgi:hypothetical protein